MWHYDGGAAEMKQIYICHDTITGLYSALYDAWKESRDREAGIELRGKTQQRLFCEYTVVDECEKKAVSVERMIKHNLGYNTYWDFYHALLSDDPSKGEAVFKTMQAARTIPDSTRIMEHLSDPNAAKVFELSRRVSNEAHTYKEFIRFRELENGVLFSEISPKSQVLTCIAGHFADRFPLENWVIWDKTHHAFLVHKARQNWGIVWGEELNRGGVEKISRNEAEYEKLWQGFFESISIKERENPHLQRTNLRCVIGGKCRNFIKNSCIKQQMRL